MYFFVKIFGPDLLLIRRQYYSEQKLLYNNLFSLAATVIMKIIINEKAVYSWNSLRGIIFIWLIMVILTPSCIQLASFDYMFYIIQHHWMIWLYCIVYVCASCILKLCMSVWRAHHISTFLVSNQEFVNPTKFLWKTPRKTFTFKSAWGTIFCCQYWIQPLMLQKILFVCPSA